MNKVFENNVMALSKKYQGMDQMLKDAKKWIEDDTEVLIERTKEGHSIFKVHKDDRICYLNGKRNPIEPVQKTIESLGKLNKGALIYMVGVGNGDYLIELAKRVESETKILIYEPSYNIFMKMLETTDISEVIENNLVVFLVKGMMDQKVEDIISSLFILNQMPFTKQIVLPNYGSLFYQDVVDFLKKIKEHLFGKLVNQGTRDKFAGIAMNNFFHNIIYLPDSYKSRQLADIIPRDIPGIIVAAGPSLDKNIYELKKAKNKAFIIAVDTAVRPLLNAGIIPDMFATVDGLKPLSLIEYEEIRNVPLLTSIVASKEILRYHKGKKIFFNEGYQYMNRYFYLNHLSFEHIAAGGSVATMAFSLAYMIGLDRIILVGQDLAYTGDKTYADGTFQGKIEKIDWESTQQIDREKEKEYLYQNDPEKYIEWYNSYVVSKGKIMVEGNYEDLVPTGLDLKLYIDWFSDYIEKCPRKGLHVINATEGGAKIKNTEVMTLKEAIERECTKTVNIQECFDNMPKLFNEEQRKYIIDEFHKTPKYFQDITDNAEKNLELYKKIKKQLLKQTYSKKIYKKLKKELDKGIENIEKSPVYQCIQLTLTKMEYLIQQEQYWEEESVKEEIEEVIRKGILSMKLIGECATLLKEVSEETVAQVE